MGQRDVVLGPRLPAPSRPAPPARTAPRPARPGARWSAARTRRPGRRAARPPSALPRTTGSGCRRRPGGSSRAPPRNGLDLRPEPGEPVPQVQRVGHQRHRGLGRDTHRGTELLGHERRHPRRAVAAERGVAVPRARAVRRRPRSPYPSRWWPGAARTTRRRCGASVLHHPVLRSASEAAASRAESSRSSTSIADALTCLHDRTQPETTDNRTRPEPLTTGGSAALRESLRHHPAT